MPLRRRRGAAAVAPRRRKGRFHWNVPAAVKLAVPLQKVQTLRELQHAGEKLTLVLDPWPGQKLPAGIGESTRDLVARVGAQEKSEEVRHVGEALGKCPLCGGDVVPTPKGHGCSNWKAKGCKFIVWGTMSEKKITPAMVKEFLGQCEMEEIKGFKSWAGK